MRYNKSKFTMRGGLMAEKQTSTPGLTYEAKPGPEGALSLRFHGRLDATTTSPLWDSLIQDVTQHRPTRVLVEAGEVDYCDGSGLALLFQLKLRGRRENFTVEIIGLREQFHRLLDLYDPAPFDALPPQPHGPNVIEEIGRGTVELWRDMGAQVAFVGELFTALVRILWRPRRMRWKEIFITAERAGANAVGIVILLSFLFGLIITFSSAMPLERFGAQIYVADLSAIAMTRVLGPVLTAIILAGRSGSAFAAELGTMKVNSEIDALKTMGLEPVAFLVVPKVLASVIISPLLTILSNAAGLAGTAVVLLILGFPFVEFTAHVKDSITPQDVMAGLFKTLIFGLLVGGVSCLRGLQAGTDASSVGIATTRAVVSSIVLIVVAEGVFAVLYHYMGI